MFQEAPYENLTGLAKEITMLKNQLAQAEMDLDKKQCILSQAKAKHSRGQSAIKDLAAQKKRLALIRLNRRKYKTGLNKTIKEVRDNINKTKRDSKTERNSHRQVLVELRGIRVTLEAELEKCEGPPEFGKFIRRHAKPQARRMWKKSSFKFNKSSMECAKCKYKSKKDRKGNQYNGQWDSGVEQGRGALIRQDGKIIWEGYFAAGFVRYGRMSNTTGNYLGEFNNARNNLPNGRGKYMWANGRYYDGGWKNGKENGRGTLYNRYRQAKKQGNWKNGRFLG